MSAFTEVLPLSPHPHHKQATPPPTNHHHPQPHLKSMGDLPAVVPGLVPQAQPAAAKPRFIITGFGKFCGVAHNPSEQLVEWLRGSQEANLEHSSYSISSLNVLEVSAVAVDQYVQQQEQLLLKQAAAAAAQGASSGAPQPIVLLHLGVDAKRPAISLEQQAFNNATFRCPDEAGWQPEEHLIEAAPGLGTSSIRTSLLPVQELAQKLREAGFQCAVSHDAGRFVCNYIYYRSLQLTAKLQQQLQQLLQQSKTAAATAGASSSTGASQGNNCWPCFSLFVHVPSFDVIRQGRQREFLRHLLDVVAECVGAACQEQQPAAAT